MSGARRIAIYGGSGYGTSELLRLLYLHPAFDVTAVISSSRPGERVDSVHTHLRGLTDLRFTSASDLDPGACDALVAALPHGKAAELLPPVLGLRPDLKLVDLSADFRLRDPEDYPRFYGNAHPYPDLLEGFQYGLPELYAEQVAAADRVANPGCFATAQVLALAPFVATGLAGDHAVVSGATGSSGSGADPGHGTHHPERTENYRAYKPLVHQHTGEVAQTLREVAGRVRGHKCPGLHFVPHSAPMARGIYLTAALFPHRTVEEAEVQELLAAWYQGQPFVRVLEAVPSLGPVLRTNFCDLWATTRDGCVLVVAALDNLVKGMAGQAVQNLNLMFGMEQDTGLLLPGWRP